MVAASTWFFLQHLQRHTMIMMRMTKTAAAAQPRRILNSVLSMNGFSSYTGSTMISLTLIILAAAAAAAAAAATRAASWISTQVVLTVMKPTATIPV